MNLQAFSRHGLSLLLVAAIVACTLWIGRTIDRRGAVPAPGTGQDAQGGRGEVRLAPDFTLLRPGQDLAETTDRPLFEPTRRPRFSALPAAVAPASVPQTLPRGRYALAGVSILPDKRIALLRDLATGMTVRVAEKDRLGGMLVASVTPYKVVLKQDGESEELPLRVAPASGMPTPSVAAPALTAPPPPPAPPAAAEPPKP